ncbi:hypothetical protein [Arachidicoccus ginsenosidivorans]|uniref:hypothetical protein n=1 Tax=Arachidicoccus ginsenosidivorans TaxID=496057 RepID=UPI0013153462|nr:hypothetical protein [Arachidicoccus ginsenosidivorans]
MGFFDGLAGVTNKVESWGLADLYRIPKFSYYFFQSQQKTDSTMVYIADYWAKTKSRDQTDNPKKLEKSLYIAMATPFNFPSTAKPLQQENRTAEQTGLMEQIWKKEATHSLAEMRLI